MKLDRTQIKWSHRSVIYFHFSSKKIRFKGSIWFTDLDYLLRQITSNTFTLYFRVLLTGYISSALIKHHYHTFGCIDGSPNVPKPVNSSLTTSPLHMFLLPLIEMREQMRRRSKTSFPHWGLFLWFAFVCVFYTTYFCTLNPSSFLSLTVCRFPPGLG